jgi:TolA-binding protein
VEAQFRVAEYLLRDAGDAVNALPLYQAVFEADATGPMAGYALRGLALARYERSDLDDAMDLFLRVTEEYPQVPLNEQTYVWAGQRYFDQQKWTQAAKMLEALLARIPAYPYADQARFKAAECIEHAGKPEDAIARYQAVIDAAPSGSKAVEAKYRMARLYETLKQPEKALKLYETAANDSAGEAAAQARFRLGELYEAKNEFDKAARSYMRVAILFMHPELTPKALWRAGQCFERSGGIEQARKAYQEIPKDYPESPFVADANTALARLAQGSGS